MAPRKFAPSARRTCARCHMTRASHAMGLIGACSKFCNVLPRGYRGLKLPVQPTTRERVWAEDDSTKGRDE